MTQIRNPAALTQALAHHARDLEPLVGVLALGVLLELQPRGWEVWQSGVGAQSFSLRRDVEWHLRGVGQPMHRIEARDRWFSDDVTETVVMRTRMDVVRFIQRLAA